MHSNLNKSNTSKTMNQVYSFQFSLQKSQQQQLIFHCGSHRISIAQTHDSLVLKCTFIVTKIKHAHVMLASLL